MTGYRTALANGKARVVATKTVYGEKAVILRFKTSDGLYEDVAVSTATHVPLRVSHGSFGGRGNPVPMGPTWRVLAIDSSRTWTRLPKAVVIARSMTAFDTYIRRVSVSTARAALGHTPVWPGPVVAGTTTLRSIELDRLTTTIGRNTSAARGLHLNYRGPQGALTVQEAAKAEAAGGFLTPKYGLDLYPIPAAGQALVVSDSYRIAGGPAHLTWRAELRTHGLYVTISSTSRSLVVAAARALAPMR